MCENIVFVLCVCVRSRARVCKFSHIFMTLSSYRISFKSLVNIWKSMFCSVFTARIARLHSCTFGNLFAFKCSKCFLFHVSMCNQNIQFHVLHFLRCHWFLLLYYYFERLFYMVFLNLFYWSFVRLFFFFVYDKNVSHLFVFLMVHISCYYY